MRHLLLLSSYHAEPVEAFVQASPVDAEEYLSKLTVDEASVEKVVRDAPM
jgi:hypothetical protein